MAAALAASTALAAASTALAAALAASTALAALHCCLETLPQASPVVAFVETDDRPPVDMGHDLSAYSPLFPGEDKDTYMVLDYWAEDTA
ncbi:hypothetical protein [Peribacillus sp. TH16]|uniref:hypothetical protein n=1 Tax=Peribacillus sp. TH16 TaxID=2798482 RepID=UPI001F5BE78C|nr:hypothetical protein [Peribacillus sp. TH16]